MSTDRGCAPGKSSLIGLGSARDYDGCAILHYVLLFPLLETLLVKSLVISFKQRGKICMCSSGLTESQIRRAFCGDK